MRYQSADKIIDNLVEGTVFASVVTVIKPEPTVAAPAVDERIGARTP